MIIGITDTFNKKFDNYVHWLKRVAQQVEVIKLSHEANNLKEIKKCDGLILTGGSDVHPKFYGRDDLATESDDINEKRDEFEIKLVKEAVKTGTPIFGICRGMQVCNVALGGSLIFDLEREGHKNHGKTKDGKDRRHKVEIERNTTLHWIVETAKGEVNTAHHQAVDVAAKGLRVTARSSDGVVEGLEWEESESRPFLQLVQWHPERMEDHANPCAKNVLEHFVLAAVSWKEE